ncbi:hypothetical protein JKP88DRAFT_347223 [Tribonema minus]|uniref:Ankyrin repeat protein n=1 Tax=Tribonema minus TaxID=303371 RepID=A0A835YR45_9STRA|nr:hypothetical protein JKP88DRAFT_347223 [Tribonema minus]
MLYTYCTPSMLTKAPPKTPPPQNSGDLTDAAAELPLLEVEQDCIKAILRQLACDAADTAPVPGVATLNTAMAMLQQRLTALKAANDCHNFDSLAQHANATATSEVFSSTHLLGTIMSFAAPGAFLFVATVSRRVGAVAMQVASVHGAGSVCVTGIDAALSSASRLALALVSTGFTDLVQLLSSNETRLPCPCGSLGKLESLQAVESMQLAGMHVCSEVLIGAAIKCNIGHLRSISAAESWPPHYFYVLCNAAAMFGHIGTLNFLLEHGRQLFSDQRLRLPTPDDASTWGYKGAIVFTDAHGTDHALTLVDAAAMADDASVLRWLHARHPPLQFTRITMTLAAGCGGLPTMKWLRAQGCSHDINEVAKTLLQMRQGAATPPKMEWVRSCGGGDWSAQGMTDMLVEALTHSSPALARWLRAEGARWPTDLAEVVMTKPGPVEPRTLLWAVQQGCPFDLWTSEVCEVLSERSAEAAAVKLALHDLGCPCGCPRP